MPVSRDFYNMKVWQKSHLLTLAIYQMTRMFPKEEQYGLTNQMRRAAASIPTNIAEGSGRGSSAEFARFLQMSMGSAAELEYQLLLARDLEYLADDRHQALHTTVLEIKMMLAAFIKRMQQS
ncbi:MAG: four helix bundle protein [Anaerolineae bacterium]|nr:four helix bundle protein [Anaerolineae bacterium]